jgi:threonine/homoserine/homoserine lactone efflux protein
VALAGLLAALVAHHAAFRAVQVAGAGYLVYLGLRMASGGTVTAGATRIDGAAHGRPYVDGLITQLSNPKAILYWTALRRYAAG